MIEFQIHVDWECTDWAGTHDFTQDIDDVTSYVPSLKINRNKAREENIYPAAQLELILNNQSKRFYPTNISSDLYGLIRLWLPVRVRAVFDSITYNLFYGFLNRITAYPIKDKQNIYFYATDGIDLMAKQIIIQDMDDKTQMTDGAAIDEILDAGGWNATRRDIDYDGGSIINLPDTFAYTKP